MGCKGHIHLSIMYENFLNIFELLRHTVRFNDPVMLRLSIKSGKCFDLYFSQFKVSSTKKSRNLKLQVRKGIS